MIKFSPAWVNNTKCEVIYYFSKENVVNKPKNSFPFSGPKSCKAFKNSMTFDPQSKKQEEKRGRRKKTTKKKQKGKQERKKKKKKAMTFSGGETSFQISFFKFSVMCVCWLVAYRPSNMRVYLRDGSAQTILCAATLRYKLQIKLSISPSHSMLTTGQPVPAL